MNLIGRVAIASVALSLTLTLVSTTGAHAESKMIRKSRHSRQVPPADPTPTIATQAGAGATAAAQAPQAPVAQPARGGDLVALQGPKQIVQSGAGWKQNAAYISIKQGQDILPMTMTITNGASGAAKMSGVRVNLNGRKLATEADFKGQDKISLDMSGLLAAGDTQMFIQTFGPSGATLEWVLTTPKIKVTGLKPDNGAPGDKVTISGKNLPKDKSAYQLFMGKVAATIQAVTDKSIDFLVPTGLPGGNQQVTLYIAGVKCDPMTFKLKAAPEINSCNMIETCPGGAINISGKGFSKVSSENEVTVAGMVCQVVSTSENSITALIPQGIACPQYDCQIMVKTNGQESKTPNGPVTVNVSQRVIQKGEGFFPGSVPTN